MPVLMEPGMITQGHIFVRREEGGRYVEVRLASDVYEAQSGTAGHWDEKDHGMEPHEARFNELRFDFALTLPDGLFDFEELDLEQIYMDQSLPDLNENELRTRLENLPCCVTNDDGNRNGDPLNIVLVGEFQDVMYALSRARQAPGFRRTGWRRLRCCTYQQPLHLWPQTGYRAATRPA
jgi:hypothetical protein